MSATAAVSTNVVEYIRALSPADKNAVLVELLTEVRRTTGGTGLIQVRDANREVLGYVVPPTPTKEQIRAMVERMTPEERTRGNAALQDLSNTFDIEEFFNEPDPEGRD